MRRKKEEIEEEVEETEEVEELSEKELKKKKQKESVEKRKNAKRKDKVARWGGIILLGLIMFIGFLLWVFGEMSSETVTPPVNNQLYQQNQTTLPIPSQKGSVIVR
jgi:hypothetical protein